MTPRGAYVLAWLAIAGLYVAVAALFPTEIATIAAAAAEAGARFAKSAALGVVIVAAIAGLVRLAGTRKADRSTHSDTGAAT